MDEFSYWPSFWLQQDSKDWQIPGDPLPLGFPQCTAGPCGCLAPFPSDSIWNPFCSIPASESPLTVCSHLIPIHRGRRTELPAVEPTHCVCIRPLPVQGWLSSCAMESFCLLPRIFQFLLFSLCTLDRITLDRIINSFGKNFQKWVSSPAFLLNVIHVCPAPPG